MVVCLEQGADLHMAQLMPLLLTVSCFSKIQTGFTFLVPSHPGSPVQRAVCVCIEQLLILRPSIGGWVLTFVSFLIFPGHLFIKLASVYLDAFLAVRHCFL